MSDVTSSGRTDTASRVILASPRTLYRAFLDRETVTAWRAPEGLRAEIFGFDARTGGGYRIALHAIDGGRSLTGQSVDRVTAEFVDFLPEAMIVERVRFESDDPAFAAPMLVTTTLKPMREGTKVTILCENVPTAIAREDHERGMASSLRNLALLTE